MIINPYTRGALSPFALITSANELMLIEHVWVEKYTCFYFF